MATLSPVNKSYLKIEISLKKYTWNQTKEQNTGKFEKKNNLKICKIAKNSIKKVYFAQQLILSNAVH